MEMINLTRIEYWSQHYPSILWSKRRHSAVIEPEQEMLRFHDLVGLCQDNPYFQETLVRSCYIRLSWDWGFGEYI